MRNGLRSSVVFAVMLLVFAMSSVSSIGAVTIQTPKGTNVYVFYSGPDGDQEWKNEAADWVHQHYPQAIVLADASMLYNCHSYAWNISEGGPVYWMNTPEDDKYWNDGSYIEVPDAAKGEKVSYPYDDHSAIETTIDDMFDSKWGAYPLCRHPRTHCPYDDPNYRTKYYARYIRVITNEAYANGDDVKVASKGTLTAGSNTTIGDGATVRFVSDQTVNIESGFTLQNGGKLTAECW